MSSGWPSSFKVPQCAGEGKKHRQQGDQGQLPVQKEKKQQNNDAGPHPDQHLQERRKEKGAHPFGKKGGIEDLSLGLVPVEKDLRVIGWAGRKSGILKPQRISQGVSLCPRAQNRMREYLFERIPLKAGRASL